MGRVAPRFVPRPNSPNDRIQVMRKSAASEIARQSRIERRILWVRGRKVILDSDLARLYGVTTFNLNKAVKRNRSRFPRDFMFRLSRREAEHLIFQTGISSASNWGGPRYRPFAFTEQGVAMLSSVLRSSRAVTVNIAIMRVFVRLRELLASHADLGRKLDALEKRMAEHDSKFTVVFDAIRALMEPEAESDDREPRIGFRAPQPPD